jgi:PPOX class probable F420-dependent enzyme
MASSVPDELRYLLDDPNFGSLGTVRPDGSPQVNPMWHEFDGEHIRFTHTTKRGKYRNLQLNPGMSYLVFDPADPLIYVEVRGRLVEVIPDPTGEFYVRLGKRYGDPDQQPPRDKDDRVILVMSIERVLVH